MDLRAGPGSPEQVEWTQLLAAATLDRGSPNLTGADGARKFGVVGRKGLGLGWTLPLASRERSIRRREGDRAK